MKKRNNPLPLLNGVKPSYLVLPHEKQFYGLPLLHFLCIRFPFVGADDWRRRLNSGFVVGSDGAALDEHTLFEPGKVMFYYRKPVARTSRVFRLKKRFCILMNI